ncbi:acyl carrier protein [Streptomyces sp. SLBN-115]|uniref:acyl carrier protein n=1 Tax=Streptomyces sp. SLBN-115 TaxID=2768453 RepID=UPI0011541E82|nr:acyl carrier protein [Streptomyces sp. SLBN-115]TQJ37051.1 phosphopantetheine binding protein [Streptomyces sp. SLBN-115]
MPDHHATEPEAPTSGRLRAVVTEEWIEALGLPRSPQPRGNEDFFEAGGNSMQAIVMFDRIGARLALDPSVETLYLNGTLDALVEHCQADAEEQRAADGTRARGPGQR